MCRRSQLWGIGMIALGLGILIGCSIDSGFWCCMLGCGLIVIGFAQGIKK